MIRSESACENMCEWDVVFGVCKCVAGNQLKSTQPVGGKVRSLHQAPCKGLDKKDNNDNNNKRHTPTSYLQDSPESNRALRSFAAEYLKFLMESVRGDCRLIKLAAVLLLQSGAPDEALRADGLSLFSSLKPDFFPNHRGKASSDRVATEKKSAYGASTDRKRVKSQAGRGRECLWVG